MTRPRQVLPGQFVLINRRCTQRQFLLRPDEATNNNVLYCLGCAIQKFGMEVLMMSYESNHEHIVIYDRLGNYPEFTHYLHKLLASSQNALRGRWENMWSAEEPCSVRLIKREDVIAKMIYSAANPVLDRLVDRVHKWPGVNGYIALLKGHAFTAKRPAFYFQPDGPMPESVTFNLSIPAELGDASKVLRDVREGVERIEAELAGEIRKGARIVGRRNVLEQPWQASPTTVEPRRNLRPRFACMNPIDRKAALLEYKEFLFAYRAARERWANKLDAVFPAGTYWLRRFASVPVASA